MSRSNRERYKTLLVTCSQMAFVTRHQNTSPSSQSHQQSHQPVPIAMSQPSRPSTGSPNAGGVKGPQQQQQQLPTPPDSTKVPRAGVDWTGNITPNNYGGDTQGEHGQPLQPGGRPRRYTTYPDIVDPQQQQPAPYQSNGRRRRRTQAELLMFHALAWLGYGEVVPNVSVVTGEPLVDGDIPTHGTRKVGGEYDNDEVDNLAERVSSALTIGVNKNAREQQQGLKRGGA